MEQDLSPLDQLRPAERALMIELLKGYGPDGKRLGNVPDFIRYSDLPDTERRKICLANVREDPLPIKVETKAEKKARQETKREKYTGKPITFRKPPQRNGKGRGFSFAK